jgi:LysR family transcriptional regulator of abg operon
MAKWLMAIDPRALRTYLVVCDENSISGAARRMNISQPAVSVTIAQLEQSLNTSLFERSRSGITLTPAGIALKRRAEALESLLRDAREEVELVQHDISGPVRIGGTPGAMVSLVPRALKYLAAENVRVMVHVLERTDSQLTGLLRSGDIDVAVVTTGMDVPPDDIEEHTIVRDTFSLIVGRENNHLASRMALSDATSMRWVMPQAAGAFRRQIDALFISCDTPAPREVVRCDSLLTTKSIVSMSDYITILPHGVVAAELSIGVLRAIEIIGAPFSRNVGVRMLKSTEERTDIFHKLFEAIEWAGNSDGPPRLSPARNLN